MTSSDPPLRRLVKRRTWRIIPTLYPPLDLFERLAPAEDWEALHALESLTNDRLRDAAGDISLLPLEERVTGSGSTPIVAAFTHPGPSRFSDGSYGIYYAGLDLPTAIAESAHSRARFFADSAEPPGHFDVRVHLGTVSGRLHDVRGGYAAVHDPDSHAAARKLGSRLRAAGSFGIVYDSVRRPRGHCVAVFRASILKNDEPQGHTWPGPVLKYHWDGRRIDKYFDYEAARWVSLPA